MITLMLADDHPIVRQGLRALLTAEPGYTVVAEAADGIEAVRLAAEHKPQVLIVDLMMPGMNGLEVTRVVRSQPDPPHVILLSMHADEVYVLDALRSGAAAYVLKETDTDQLVRAVREVVAGRHYLSPPLSERAIDSYTRQAHSAPLDAFELLTARERQVLVLVAQGESNYAIASRLNISPRTAETHRTNLMRKLDLHSQAELVRFALQRGLVSGGNP
jgi:two-component system response regulator NreC